MCGLFGIVNKQPRKFDYSTFCTLGIANDSRGGDSCGYFIDGHFDYGWEKENKYFQCFFPKNEFLNTIEESQIAFGHCRKASVGAINKKTAQPVNINDEFILMHNGTIHNYKDLAKKYIPEINISGMTDSQVMAQIFYYSGYDALSEYNGAAVFVIADYRENTPKILLFKGASKEDKYVTKETEERPLYYCIDPTKQELVFSSMCSYLFACRKELTIFDFLTNSLVEFDGTDLIEIKKVSRKNCTQRKVHYYPNLYSNIKDYNNIVYDCYITPNLYDNTYLGRGKKLHGKVCLTKFGFIVEKPWEQDDYNELYFWHGVLLKNIDCFNFLVALFKKSKLKIKDFNKDFKILIRFLSMDGVYRDKDTWYQATSPTKSIVYTNYLRMLGSTSWVEIVDGVQWGTKYSKEMTYLEDIIKACKSLTKQQIDGLTNMIA